MLVQLFVFNLELLARHSQIHAALFSFRAQVSNKLLAYKAAKISMWLKGDVSLTNVTLLKAACQ